MNITANGIQINYEVRGSGPYLTMIHGAGNNLNVWQQQADMLAERFTVLTYDIRVHGQSDSGSMTVSAGMLVADLNCLLEALGVSGSIVLGHSMGAEIAIRFYYSQRGTANAIIISNSIMGALRSEEELMMMRMSRGAQSETRVMPADEDSRLARFFSPDLASLKPEVIDYYRENVIQKKKQRSDSERMLTSGLVGELMDAPLNNIHRIAVPALIINGTMDSLVRPSVVDSVAHHFDDMRAETLPTGHYPFLEMPQDFSRLIIDFAEKAGLIS